MLDDIVTSKSGLLLLYIEIVVHFSHMDAYTCGVSYIAVNNLMPGICKSPSQLESWQTLIHARRTDMLRCLRY